MTNQTALEILAAMGGLALVLVVQIGFAAEIQIRQLKRRLDALEGNPTQPKPRYLRMSRRFNPNKEYSNDPR